MEDRSRLAARGGSYGGSLGHRLEDKRGRVHANREKDGKGSAEKENSLEPSYPYQRKGESRKYKKKESSSLPQKKGPSRSSGCLLVKSRKIDRVQREKE